MVFANNYADKIVKFNTTLGDVANNIILRKKFRCYFTFAKALEAYKRTKMNLIRAKVNFKRIMDFYEDDDYKNLQKSSRKIIDRINGKMSHMC